MSKPDVIVVGGGMAGLAAAASLAGHARVRLLEREATLAFHASGRNAAIYRPLENDHTTAALARRSRTLLSELTDRPLLRATGLLLADADLKRVVREHERATALSVQCEVVSGHALRSLHPALHGGDELAALHLPDGGVLDIHEMLSALERSARDRGAELRTGAGVRRIEVTADRVTGVWLDDGTRVPCGHVVLAGGAWASQLAAACGLSMPLTAVRRHLVQLAAHGEVAVPGAAPVVWRQDQEVYFRAEGDGVLASPCDETTWTAPKPGTALPTDPRALEQLATRLTGTAPGLARAGVQTSWACLRTFAPDRELALGPDPRVRGLHWIAGLGGKGMSVGPAAGELLARGLVGGLADIPDPLRADRMIS